MKPLLLILGLVLAAGAGAVGGMMAAPRATQATAEPVARTAVAAPTSAAIAPDVEKRLQDLNMALTHVEAQLATLRDERARTVATTSTTTGPNDSLALANVSTEVFAATHKDAILKVLADDRADQERQREEERKVREQKMIDNLAERAAEKFNLSEAQKMTLSDFYASERKRTEEIRAQFRDGVQDGGQDNVREAFREAREWRTNELTRLFGTDLGAQINEFGGDRGQRGGGIAQRRGGDAAGGNGTPAAGPNGGGQAGAGQPRRR